MDVVPPCSPSRTLLIVDDDPLMIELLLQSMTRCGFRVLTAAGAREALALLETEAEPILLVITDLTMPEMDGIAFARRLCERAPNLPVLLATGYGASCCEDPLPPNIVGIVTKPYRSRALVERIDALLGAEPSLPASTGVAL